MFIVKPAAAKARAPKTLHDVGSSPNGLPDKFRLKVFNHQENRALVQAEDPRGHPAERIGASFRIGRIKTGIEPVGAAPCQLKTLDSVTDRFEDDLRRERKRGNYPPR